jgi:hypothetical protein
LSTTGLATLNDAQVTNGLTVGGNAAVEGALSVTGASTTSGITNTGNISSTGNATIGGNAAVTGNLAVTGALTASSGVQATSSDSKSQLSLVNGQASLMVTNSLGNTHGLMIGQDSTTLSGGSKSTTMTLNNNGATFANSSSGAPVKVTGIANGSSSFDAVNVRQFSSAIAGVQAAANIPGVDTNKTVSIGVGLGSFMGQQSLAFGGSYRFSNNGVVRGSLSTGLNAGDSNKSAFGIGAGWSW